MNRGRGAVSSVAGPSRTRFGDPWARRTGHPWARRTGRRSFEGSTGTCPRHQGSGEVQQFWTVHQSVPTVLFHVSLRTLIRNSRNRSSFCGSRPRLRLGDDSPRTKGRSECFICACVAQPKGGASPRLGDRQAPTWNVWARATGSERRRDEDARLSLVKTLGPTVVPTTTGAKPLDDTHPGRPRVGITQLVPTTTARPSAIWNRRPPETTLGPPSHPDDKINTSRRPAARNDGQHSRDERSRLGLERASLDHCSLTGVRPIIKSGTGCIDGSRANGDKR